MPWKRIFRELRQSHGWTDAQICELTLRQVRLIHLAEVDAGETQVMSPVQAAAYGRAMQQRRRNEFAQFMQDIGANPP